MVAGNHGAGDAASGDRNSNTCSRLSAALKASGMGDDGKPALLKWIPVMKETPCAPEAAASLTLALTLAAGKGDSGCAPEAAAAMALAVGAVGTSIRASGATAGWALPEDCAPV